MRCIAAGCRRFVHHATTAHSTSRIAAGTSAPTNTSCVLMMRTDSCVRLVASVCARIIASPSRISTSDGGITTPIVLATHTSAAPRSGGTPDASSRGLTVRDSIATLAPTDPFIGASSTPRPSPGERRSGARPRQCAAAGAKQYLRERQMIEQRAHQHVQRQRLQDVLLEQSQQPRGHRRQQRQREGAGDDAARRESSATPIRTIHAGSPVAMSSTATATSMPMPAVSIMSRARSSPRNASSSACTSTSSRQQQRNLEHEISGIEGLRKCLELPDRLRRHRPRRVQDEQRPRHEDEQRADARQRRARPRRIALRERRRWPGARAAASRR